MRKVGKLGKLLRLPSHLPRLLYLLLLLPLHLLLLLLPLSSREVDRRPHTDGDTIEVEVVVVGAVYTEGANNTVAARLEGAASPVEDSATLTYTAEVAAPTPALHLALAWATDPVIPGDTLVTFPHRLTYTTLCREVSTAKPPKFWV